ncbi:MAG: glycosyltransferase family 4 protein [Deltaproteobacteria bacterium]|nr:glycosyltransferase family 4 protein [Deltaproteobacteria bacterium]
MHVLLIHQAYAGPRDPGGTRHHELATELVRRGHRVTIVASDVSYMTGDRVGGSSPAIGASSRGNGSNESAGEDAGGIRVVRVPSSRRLHRSYVDRFASFVGFGGRALRAALEVPDVDVVWGTSPPLPQLLPAWLASLRCRGGFVLEERDLWPEFAIGMGVVRDGLASRAALRFKRFLYGRARRVIVNSPGFLPFLDGYGVEAQKIRVVPNGVDPRLFDPEERSADLRRAWGAEGRFVVLYAGALGPANDLEVALDAAEELRGTEALFVLVGDGKARASLAEAAAARGLDNVRLVGAQPKDAMPQVLAAADACLATLRDIPLFRTTYPNKVFDYMAAGRPVLLLIDGVIREVVEEARAGRFVPPGDARGLAATVREWMQSPEAVRAMGRDGRRAVCARFDRRLHAAQLETLLLELVGESPSTGSQAAEACVIGEAR